MSQTEGLREADESYAEVLRALKRGMIITVNRSDPSATSTPELTVRTVEEDDPVVHLRSDSDDVWKVAPDLQQSDRMAVSHVDDRGSRSRRAFVNTLEIVGVTDTDY